MESPAYREDAGTWSGTRLDEFCWKSLLMGKGVGETGDCREGNNVTKVQRKQGLSGNLRQNDRSYAWQGAQPKRDTCGSIYNHGHWVACPAA